MYELTNIGKKEFKNLHEIHLKWSCLVNLDARNDVIKILLMSGIVFVLFSNVLNPFYAISPFLYSLQTSENLWFSDVFRGHRKIPVT